MQKFARIVLLLAVLCTQMNYSMKRAMNSVPYEERSTHGNSFVPLLYALSQDLLQASKIGDIAAMQKLINQTVPINAKSKEGVSPLMVAAYYGHIPAVELLIKHGAEINAQSKNGGTALTKAVLAGKIDVVRLLIRKGASTNYKDVHGRSLQEIARAKNHTELAQLLETHIEQENAKQFKTQAHMSAEKKQLMQDLKEWVDTL